MAAFSDAVDPPVRLRRAIGGPGVLPDQPGVEYVPNRPALDPHAGGGYGRFPLPHNPSRSDRAAAYADHRRPPHGCRRPGLCLHPQLRVPGRGRDDRRHQPKRQRGRAVSFDRAGRAGACRSRSDPDGGVRMVHAGRLDCDGYRLTRWRHVVAPAAADGDGARRELPRCGSALRRAGRSAGVAVRRPVACRRSDRAWSRVLRHRSLT